MGVDDERIPNDELNEYPRDHVALILYTYVCDACGQVYESFARADTIVRCLAVDCPGTPRRRKGGRLSRGAAPPQVMSDSSEETS